MMYCQAAIILISKSIFFMIINIVNEFLEHRSITQHDDTIALEKPDLTQLPLKSMYRE